MKELQWDDLVKTVAEDGSSHTPTDRTMSEIDARLKDKPESVKVNTFDSELDLTTLGAQSIAVLTLPAYAKIRAAWMHITETVVSGGSSAKMGLGPTGTKNKYGVTADLVAGTKTAVMYSTVNGSSTEAILLQVVQSDGTTAGGTNISAGKVRVKIEYETPNALE